MSMLCRPMWPFLLMYGSHDMRHTGFPQVDGGQRDPWEMGRHTQNSTKFDVVARFCETITTLKFVSSSEI